jgi:hypothetical protein
VLPQKQRQVICRVWLPSFAALLLLSLGCRLPVVVARRCLLDVVIVELHGGVEDRSWT